MTQAAASRAVIEESESEITGDRNQTILIELAQADIENAVDQIDIGVQQSDNLADAQSRSVQEVQDGLHCVRLQFARRQ